MKIKATMRLLPIILASAIMAISCTGVQDVANTITPTPTSVSLIGKYSYSEKIDSVRIQVETPTPQYIYLSRDYFLELNDGGTARLFISEMASADRVFITQYVGTYSVENHSILLNVKNMTLCDGVSIIVSGTIQNTNSNSINLSMDNCPPQAKNIVLAAESPISTFKIYQMQNTTTHN